MKNTRLPIKKYDGFSLVEVLVSLFLLSIMVVSVTKLQLLGLNESKLAQERSVALAQMNNMTEILRNKPTLVELAQFITGWNQETSKKLQLGKGEVEPQGQLYRIRIVWESANTNHSTTRQLLETVIRV